MTGKHAGLRTRYTARQRAELRGWVFRPLNPMPELILRAAYARRETRAANRLARRAAIDAIAQGGAPAGTPLDDPNRCYNYGRQNGTPRRPLTARQQRRRLHKANRHDHPVAQFLRETRAQLHGHR